MKFKNIYLLTVKIFKKYKIYTERSTSLSIESKIYIYVKKKYILTLFIPESVSYVVFPVLTGMSYKRYTGPVSPVTD